MADMKRQSLRNRNKAAITTESLQVEQGEPAMPATEAAPAATEETKAPAPAPAPAKAPAKKQGHAPLEANEITRIGIYLTPEQFNGAKAAYLADWLNGGDSNTFARWIGEVISAHAQRTPQERLERSALRGRATERTGSSRSFNVPTEAAEKMREAVVADQRVGRWPSESAWCAEAMDLAIEAARERNGGSLPTPPARLPNRLTR
ncbi:MAG: hypothetical protein WBX27_14640 [Specibacter sp.]